MSFEKKKVSNLIQVINDHDIGNKHYLTELMYFMLECLNQNIIYDMFFQLFYLISGF
jgi:hypothetical protein